MRRQCTSVKRASLLLGAALLAAVAVLAADPVELTIAAQQPGTGPYGFATSISKFLNDVLPPNSAIDVIPRGAAVVNPTTVDQGKADIGFSTSNATKWAWDGLPEVYGERGRHENIRCVTIQDLTVSYVVLVARKDYVDKTGYDTLEKLLNAKDLPRIAMKPPGSEGPPFFKQMMALMGKDIEEYRRTSNLLQVPQSQIGEMLRDGRVDAYFDITTLQHPSFTEITLTNDLVYYPIPDDIAKQLTVFGLYMNKMPAGSYRGMDIDYATMSAGNNIIAHKDTPEDIIYLLVKTMDERRDEFVDDNPQIRTWDQAKNHDRGAYDVPLHPGAERYYREKGWVK